VNMESRKKIPAAGQVSMRSRTFARRFALLGLYEWIVNPLSSPEAVALIVPSLIDQEDTESGDLTPEEFESCDQELFKTLLKDAISHRFELEEILERHVSRPLKQVSTVERAILLLGAAELVHHPETAYTVVIDEMVELAKQFGSAEGGYKFVNGVLDKVAREVRPGEKEEGKA